MSDEEREKYLLNRGDLLIIRVNGSKELVGQAVLFDEEGDYAFCDHFIRYSLFSQFVSPKYVSLYFRDRITRNHIAFNMVSTAGQNTISQSSLATLPITLPPLAEQHRVVARVQALFAQADAVEAAVEAARRRLDKLDQAILARAFRGELVPQDPDDEPASVLVERIRQERAAGAAQKTHPRGNKRRRGTRGVEDRLIREWAAAYRLWNEGELARRLTVAGRESMQEKLAAFFDLCETMFQIAPSKSTGLYQAQLRAHIAERERMQRFEEGRAHAESDT
jgi:type I restriction enzyme S subunit